MEKEFRIYLDSLNKDVDVTIELWASEDEHEIESLIVWDGIEEVDFESLPYIEQKKVTDKAEEVASEYAWDAFESRLQGQADALYDSWKDGD